MSEVKQEEPVKQEGEFKIKKKTPKKLTPQSSEPVKVNIKEPLIETEPEVTKVTIPSKEPVEQEVKEVSQPEPIAAEDFQQIQEVTEEEKEEVKQVTADVKEALRDEKVLGKPLPENVEKLVSFMEDTGGTVEDYVRLNADYSNVSDEALLKEYYLKTKPYLESDDVNLLLEDYSYDEELDEDIDIRKKKLALKEEVAKAKNFLEETKSKYYDEIKLRPGVTQDQQKAMDFFNRYNQEQSKAEQQHKAFKDQTKKLFSEEFKGFDFSLGEKKFRYGVKDPGKVAETQSNINNIVGKFLNSDGSVKDPAGYHKAMYAAANADTIANHFYEQGKADAVKEVINGSKNPSQVARQAPQTGFKDGIKVKVLGETALDTSKLRIKKIKI